jgi:GNAT superfamily N-acetyltransferase
LTRFAIRLAVPDDAAAVTALLHASYPILMEPPYTPDVLAAALPSMTRANVGLLASGSYFVAENKTGGLVGSGGWTRQVPGTGVVDGNAAHIRHFVTHPDWIGQGIGRALYKACETQARDAGIIGFDCFASLNAEGFYAALGFERVERIEVAMPGVNFPGILMRRPLRNSA